MNTPTAIPPVINPANTITYDLTRWDLFVNWMTVMIRNRMMQIFIPASMILCTGLQLLPKLRRESLPELIFDGVIYCLGFIGVLVFFQIIMGLASTFLMPHRGVIGQHTLEITDAGLIERTDVNETLHRWPGVCRITSLFGYLFIYVGETNSHQVPKRALAPELIAHFEAELRARLR